MIDNYIWILRPRLKYHKIVSPRYVRYIMTTHNVALGGLTDKLTDDTNGWVNRTAVIVKTVKTDS